MKSLLVFASLAFWAAAAPQQRGGQQCQCRDVICPNNGRDACECLNRAAEDCFRQWRNPNCPSPAPLNCNGPLPRPPNNPFQSQNQNQNQFGWQTGSNGVSTWNNNNGGRPTSGADSTYYSVVPYRTTMTTTLPGFGWPNPVQSLSYGMSTTTITLTRGQLPQSSSTNFPKISTVTQPRSGSSTTRPWTPPWQISQGGNQPPPSQNPPPSPPPSSPPPPPKTPAPTPSRQTTLAPRPSSSRPAPWTPPVEDGQQPWTPVALPTVPAEPEPTAAAPPPPPPPPPSPPEPQVPSGPPAKCGPGMAKCTGATYCDPQPLCSIGEDCPGVCLPITSVKAVTRLGLVNSFAVQPWEKRREFWQKMLDEGYYVMYRYYP